MNSSIGNFDPNDPLHQLIALLQGFAFQSSVGTFGGAAANPFGSIGASGGLGPGGMGGPGSTGTKPVSATGTAPAK